MNLRKIFLWSMIVSLVIAALLGIAALLLPRYGPNLEILASVALFASFSLIALISASVMERVQLVWLMRTGIAAAVAALIVWLALVWFDPVTRPRVELALLRLAGSLSIASVLAPQCGLLLLARLDNPWTRRVRWTTVAISIALAAYGVGLIWLFDVLVNVIDEESLVRWLGVLAILAACGTVITPILWKVQTVRHGDGTVPAVQQVKLFCPLCSKQQILPTGPARCAACGLRIRVEFEEPRCVCGYLLHNLGSDRCPECGTPVPTSGDL